MADLNPKYIWENPLERMYGYIFRSMNAMGNIPYAYLEDESRVMYFNRAVNSCFYLFLLNCFLYPFFFLKNVALTLYCVLSDKYEPGFELLGVWCIGSLFFLTTFLNQAILRKEITTMLTAWLRFEKYMKEFGPPVDPAAQKRRILFLWLEFLFYCVGGFLVPILVGLLYVVYPRLPCFLYSVVPRSLDEEPEWWFRRNLFKFAGGLLEVYVPVMGCTVIFATDILVSMICKRVSFSLELLTRANSANLGSDNQTNWLKKQGPVSIYKSIQILIGIFHTVYSRLICASESITLLLLVASLFVAINPNTTTHPILRLVMGTVAFLVGTHTLTFFLPLANVRAKSLKFLDSMICSESSSTLSLQQIRSCPLVQIKPSGLHKVTHISVLEMYMLTVNFLLLLFEMEIGV